MRNNISGLNIIAYHLLNRSEIATLTVTTGTTLILLVLGILYFVKIQIFSQIVSYVLIEFGLGTFFLGAFIFTMIRQLRLSLDQKNSFQEIDKAKEQQPASNPEDLSTDSSEVFLSTSKDSSIDTLKNDESLFPLLPYELVQLMVGNLDLRDLYRYSQTCKAASQHVFKEMLIRAKEHGYKGVSISKGARYYQELLNEVAHLRDELPKELTVNHPTKSSHIDAVATLNNLKTLDRDKFFAFFSCEKISELFSCQRIAQFFIHLTKSGKIVAQTTPKQFSGHQLFFGDVAMIKLFLMHGYDQHKCLNPFNNPSANECETSPIHLAANWGRLNVVKLLLEQGIDSNEKKTSPQGSFTPLFMAVHCIIGLPFIFYLKIQGHELAKQCYHNKMALVKLLIERGADPNIACGRHNTLPLFLAAGAGLEKIVQYLLPLTDYRGKEDEFLSAILTSPFGWNILELVKKLLDEGANPNSNHFSAFQTMMAGYCSRSTPDIPPLHKAIERGDQDLATIQLLIERGADIHFIHNGYTPLSVAVATHFSQNCFNKPQSTLKIISLLIEHGAELDVAGITPLLEIATDRCGKIDPELVKLLMAHGAPINKANANGQTSLPFLQYRRYWGEENLPIIKLLESHKQKIKSKKTLDLFRNCLY